MPALPLAGAEPDLRGSRSRARTNYGDVPVAQRASDIGPEGVSRVAPAANVLDDQRGETIGRLQFDQGLRALAVGGQRQGVLKILHVRILGSGHRAHGGKVIRAGMRTLILQRLVVGFELKRVDGFAVRCESCRCRFATGRQVQRAKGHDLGQFSQDSPQGRASSQIS